MIASRYLKREEFMTCALAIKGTEPLYEIADILFKGLVRGTFYNNICYSLQGVYPLPTGIGDAWMISDHDLLKKYPLAAHRSAKVTLSYAFHEFGFTRIHITVPDTDVKWCESIGFSKIGKVNEKYSLVMFP
jgi:hypothetical protein